MEWSEILKILIAPIIGFIVVPSIVWAYKKLDTKIDELEKRAISLEIKHSTLDERVSNMRQDLKDIKEMLRQLLNKS